MKKDKDTAVVAQIVHDYIGVHETPYIEFTARDTSEYREPVLVEIARGPRKSPAQGWTGSRCRCTTPTEAPAPLQYMRSICVPESASIPGVGSHKVGVLLKRTKISPHPHNASVREDLLKDYIHTRKWMHQYATYICTKTRRIQTENVGTYLSFATHVLHG